MQLISAAPCCLAVLALFSPAGVCHAQGEAAPAKKERQRAMVRMLCVQSLAEGDDELLLAKKTKEGEWKEHGMVTLRSPFITEWKPVPPGVNHLVRKQGDEMISVGSFAMPADLKRAVLVLLPDVKNKAYRIQVIDPAKAGFRKGKALILNYGRVTAVVKMGGQSVTVAPGKQVVETIGADKDGMCRLLIGHVGEDKRIVPCYDRFISTNPNTRKFVMLFPDKVTGLRAMSLSEFGPFDEPADGAE